MPVLTPEEFARVREIIMEQARAGRPFHEASIFDNVRPVHERYTPPPGFVSPRSPGSVWHDAQGLVIEGDFKVVSHGR